MSFASLWRRAALIVGIALALSNPSSAHSVRYGHPSAGTEGADNSQLVSIVGGRGAQQIIVAAGKSQLVRFDRHFQQIVVGSKDIAEVVPLSSNTIYVLGKKRGATNLAITDGGHAFIAAVDVVVTYDIDGLKRAIDGLVPGADIKISPAGDALILSGQVQSAGDLRKILAVANNFAPGQITNLLQISGSQQVMLEVKFSEVQRNALQNLGLTVANAGLTNAGNVSATASVAQTAFGTVGGLLSDSRTYFVHAQVDALETKGFVHTLAEPNLVALSGDTASFLAGGEFPIPVVQSSTGTVPTTTIEYKDFGVGLAFTPTVVSSDLVNLAIKSEVSSLDPTASVTTSGITVPGLKVRRASTTVELRDGETFAIAGLIQNDFQNTMNALPGLGNIPVLGALFRSVNFKHQQSELVVFITVHLVQPLGKGGVMLPTEAVGQPSVSDMDLLGNMGGKPVPPPPPPPPPAPDAMPAPQPSAPPPAQSSDAAPAPQPSAPPPAQSSDAAPAPQPSAPPSAQASDAAPAPQPAVPQPSAQASDAAPAQDAAPVQQSALSPTPALSQQASSDPIAAQGYVLP